MSGGAVPRVEVPDQELNAVTIVRRGATVGYDNPGFQSPWSRAYTRSGPRLSALDWPDSPAMSRHTGLLKKFSMLQMLYLVKNNFAVMKYFQLTPWSARAAPPRPGTTA